MKQEDKELLLKDLCARLPYGVKVQVADYKTPVELSHINTKNGNGRKPYCFVFAFEPERVKPYLRPMSSMTEEEKEEIAFIRDRDFQSVRKWIHDESIKETGNICPITCGEIDYCNKKHLDYRGLIEKGLALEVPKDIYNIK